VPTFDANWAIQSARQIGYARIGAHADGTVTPAPLVASGRDGQPQQLRGVLPEDAALVGLG
jgi:hypothetical protein